MQLAIVAAGFTPGEADRLRRAMAAWKRKRRARPVRAAPASTACARAATTRSSREQVFQQILGFGEYGFPESHAASFALLVYVSAWLKRHEPAAFCCALLNSQPMGFYAPAQLVRDAQRTASTVRRGGRQRERRGLARWRTADGNGGGRAAARPRTGAGPCTRGRRSASSLHARKAAFWQRVRTRAPRGTRAARPRSAGRSGRARGTRRPPSPRVLGRAGRRACVAARTGRRARRKACRCCCAPTEGEDIVADYRALGFTLARHPLALLRARLEQDGWHHGERGGRACRWRCPCRTGGIVVTRQRPGSAGGVIFVTLEDETGYVNLIVWSRIADRHRKALLGARLLGVSGRAAAGGRGEAHRRRHPGRSLRAAREPASRKARTFVKSRSRSLRDRGDPLAAAARSPGASGAVHRFHRCRNRRNPTGGRRCASPRGCAQACARPARSPRRARRDACGCRNPASICRRRGPLRLPRVRRVLSSSNSSFGLLAHASSPGDCGPTYKAPRPPAARGLTAPVDSTGRSAAEAR